MKYLSAKELAELWGIDVTRAHRLAREGRIDGARLFGRNWVFPPDVKKPADGRTKAVKKAPPEGPTFRFPMYVNFREKDYLPPLSGEELQLRRAQKEFYAGRFNKAQELLLPLEEAENRYVRTASFYHRLYIAIYASSPDFDSLLWKMNAELSQDFPYQKELLLLRYSFDVDNATYGSLLEEFNIDEQYDYHPSAYCMLHLISLPAIENGDFSLLRKLRYDTYELICQHMEREGYFLEAQKLHYLLLLVYHLQHNEEKMAFHIRRGLELAQEHELYFSAALYAGWYPSPTFRVLHSFPPEFAERILALGKMMQEKWIRFNEARQQFSYLNRLSSKEFEFAFLANQGYTNRQIARKFSRSEKTVSKTFAAIYQKLGVKTKQELVEMINNTHLCSARTEQSAAELDRLSAEAEQLAAERTADIRTDPPEPEVREES